jgi:hypothetical protein
VTGRARFLFGLLVAAILLTPGCGADKRRGEVETTSTSQPASAASTQRSTNPGPQAVPAEATNPARRTYVARVDRICSRLDPERESSTESVGRARDPQQAAAHYDDTIALGEKQLRQIQAVPEPPGDRRTLRANVFDVIDQQLAIRRQLRTALAASDLSHVRRLRARLDGLTRSLVGFARGYGFQVCGED